MVSRPKAGRLLFPSRPDIGTDKLAGLRLDTILIAQVVMFLERVEFRVLDTSGGVGRTWVALSKGGQAAKRERQKF